jgi:WD40 repeat protein
MSLTPSLTPTPSRRALSVANVQNIVQLNSWGKGVVSEIAWSPDGTLLALGSTLGVYIFDTRTQRQQRFIQTATNVYSLAFSPDGHTLATGDTRVHLWEVATGRPITTLPGEIKGFISELAYSPGGMWLAASGPMNNTGGDPPGRYMIWRTSDNSVVNTWGPPSCGYGANFAFSPDGRSIAFKEFCGIVDLQRVASGEPIPLPQLEIYSVNMTFTPDGASLVYGTGAGEISFMSIATKKVLKTLPVAGDDRFCLSPDGKSLVSSDLQVWDTQTERLRFDLKERGTCAISPDSQKLATATYKGDVHFWNIMTGQALGTLPWPSVASSVAFGNYLLPGQEPRLVLAAGDERGQVTLIDPHNGETLTATQVSTQKITALGLNSSGQMLAYATVNDYKAVLSVRNLATNQVIRTIEFHVPGVDRNEIPALAFSLDGQAIAAKPDTLNKILAWDIQTGNTLDQPGSLRWYNANGLGADANGHLVGLDYDEETTTYRVSDRHTGQLMASIKDAQQIGPCQDLLTYTLSPDDRYLAMGCDIPSLPVWELPPARLSSNFTAHRGVSGEGFYGNILQVDFSPFGYLLASSGYDATIRFWDVKAGRLLLTLANHKKSVFAIALSPDGQYLASASDDGTLRLWGLPR